jgi:hypothetical protein
MSKVVELFGKAADAPGIDWQNEIADQQCPFLGKRCYKVRKSTLATLQAKISPATLFHPV